MVLPVLSRATVFMSPLPRSRFDRSVRRFPRFQGVKMAGQHGNASYYLSPESRQVDAEKGLIMIIGAVPVYPQYLC